MNISRFYGRFVGFQDAVGLKYSGLEPEKFFSLSEQDRNLYSAKGVQEYGYLTVFKKLFTLANEAMETMSSREQLFGNRDIIIGTRESHKVLRNHESIGRLTLPVDILTKEEVERIPWSKYNL